MRETLVIMAALNGQANDWEINPVLEAVITFFVEHAVLFTGAFAILLGVICYRTYKKYKEQYEINLLFRGGIMAAAGYFAGSFTESVQIILLLAVFIALLVYDAKKCGVRRALLGLLIAPVVFTYVAAIVILPFMLMLGRSHERMMIDMDDGVF